MNSNPLNDGFLVSLVKVATLLPCHDLTPLELYLWNFARFDRDFPVEAHRVEQHLACRSFVKGEESEGVDKSDPLAENWQTTLYDRAILHYRKALVTQPGCSLCWFNLGTCYLKLKRFIDAVVCLKASLALCNSDPALLNLGIAYSAILLSRRPYSRIWRWASKSRFRLIHDPCLRLSAEFHEKYFELLDLYYNRFIEARDNAKDFFRLFHEVAQLLPLERSESFIDHIDTSELSRQLVEHRIRRLKLKARPVIWKKGGES